MRERVWLNSKDPEPMLTYLLGPGTAVRHGPSGTQSATEYSRMRTSNRKFRLFAVACCRMGYSRILHPRCRRAVEVAERYADGTADEQEFYQAADTTVFREGEEELVGDPNAAMAAYKALSPAAYAAARDAAHWMVLGEGYAVTDHVGRAAQADLARCIFGNPIRPRAFDPRWRTEAATVVAQAIYDDRAFDRLPVLADALAVAGCADVDILAHCRGDGPHARGCWVVDAVLDKR